MNTRLDYIDKLRGFAILLVVIGHLYQEHTAAGNDYPISQMIYSFHMSLFFFISGYVCELTHKIDKIGYISFLKKKAVALLIPWIFWVLAVNLILPKTRVQSIGNLCIAFNFYPNRLYWFMPVLFLAMLLYAVQYKIIHKSDSIKKRLLYICVLGIGLSCFGILLYEYALLIYAIYATSFLSGAILKNQPKIQKTILNNKYFGGGSIILCVLWLFYPFEANGRALYSMLNVIMTFLCSASAIIVFYNFFVKERLNRYVNWFFIEMGKMTIVIYMTPLAFFPRGYLFDGLTMTAENIIIIGVAVVHCLVAYVIGKSIYTIPFLRLIMYGKK